MYLKVVSVSKRNFQFKRSNYGVCITINLGYSAYLHASTYAHPLFLKAPHELSAGISEFFPKSSNRLVLFTHLVGLFAIFFGIVSFLSGFLLMRSELSNTTASTTVAGLTSDSRDYFLASVGPPHFDRIIILIVDALSHDLMYRLAGSLSSQTPTASSQPVYRMAHLQRLHQEKVGRLAAGYLAHFVADPPTTTLQRLKGILTGSMPTFIDAGSNFGGSLLSEDNLVWQWQAAGKLIAFVGDDTWMQLFQGRFSEALPYPSFDVNDLDTVDKGVRNFFHAKLSNDIVEHANNWSILIGHMLGVDHCGHRYGPAHPEMDRKLAEVDELIG
ncbi:unnamed protein product [Protopolystoma xenopodis]|uniref:GPI ethanolamine phosphate transferase 3 n=1 Tax=Protopolystoma xenopodis TaxID=117903 RepID=A0A3S5C4T4_9PLAT|nr:unnamed protein product [Protopolystoma xenopodis]